MTASASGASAPGAVRSGRYAATPWSERRLYRPFIRAAILLAILPGFASGTLLLAAPALGWSPPAWAANAQGHATVQVFGWAGLFVMGVASHVVPRFRSDAAIAFPWPQRLSLAAIVLARLLRLPATAWVDAPAGAAVLVASGALLFAGVTGYALTIGCVLRSGSRSSDIPVERWFWAGFAWAVIAAAIHWWVTIDMASNALPAASAGTSRALVFAGLFGFIGNIFLGMSLRAVSGFLGLRPYHRPLERAAFAALNAGAATVVLAALVSAGERFEAAGTLLLAAAALVFLVALRVFEPRTPGPTRLSYPRYPQVLLGAYAWLAVGMLLLAWEAAGQLVPGFAGPVLQARASLHVVTMGAITMAIFGFASRALPLFEGAPIRRVRAMDLAVVGLHASVVLRLAFSVRGAPAAHEALALSGVLGLAALAAFAVAMASIRTPWPVGGSG